MAEIELGKREYSDIAFDLMAYVIERLNADSQPVTEKDILALYERCKWAVLATPKEPK